MKGSGHFLGAGKAVEGSMQADGGRSGEETSPKQKHRRSSRTIGVSSRSLAVCTESPLVFLSECLRHMTKNCTVCQEEDYRTLTERMALPKVRGKGDGSALFSLRIRRTR